MQSIKNIRDRSLILLQETGLIIIAIATVISIGTMIATMIEARDVTLADLLLLFIYLEVLTMVSIYLDSGKLPVIIPLYIAIVALARYLTIDMKELDTPKMLAISGAILLISFSVIIIKYSHTRFPPRNDIT